MSSRDSIQATIPIVIFTINNDNNRDIAQLAIVLSVIITNVTTTAMDQEKPPKRTIRRPEVLKKLTADSLLAIERGLLGDLPEKLRPQPLPVRGRPTLDIAAAKSSSILSSCLIPPDSASSGGLTSSDDECSSPAIKKTFSFRDKLSRLSFFGKDKERPKAIVEDEYIVIEREKFDNYKAREQLIEKSKNRFWFNKRELEKKERENRPVYKRSKSFEFLPQAVEEDDEDINEFNQRLAMSSFRESYDSKDNMNDVWSSDDSLELSSPPLKNDNVFLENKKKDGETTSVSMKSCGSSISTVNSTNSSGVATTNNIMQRDSVQCLLNEFEKAVELFSENYLSDSEPYTKHEKDLERANNSVTLKEKRKSSSLPSLTNQDSVVKNSRKVSEISDDFKKELSFIMSENKKSVVGRFLSNNCSYRRGSVTDWFVLEERGEEVSNKYSRALQKPTNRVRRMSSTKYVSTLIFSLTFQNFKPFERYLMLLVYYAHCITRT